MATDDPLEWFLKRTDPGDYQAGALAPGDIGRLSMESFMATAAGNVAELRSQGDLRLHGAGVSGNSADLADVGQLASTWQRLVSAVGGALEQVKTLRGQLPAEITNRTRLALSASPAPGSLVLRLVPKQAAEAPGGMTPLFDEPRSLVDRASEALVGLLGHAVTTGPRSFDPGRLDTLSASMLDLGPRVGGSLVSLAATLERSNITLDAAWREPHQPTRRARITPTDARWIQEFVAGRHLDAAVEIQVGVLRTISDAENWLVEIDGTPVRMVATELDPAVVSTLRVGQRVRLEVRTAFRERPDGLMRGSYRILSVEPADVIED